MMAFLRCTFITQITYIQKKNQTDLKNNLTTHLEYQEEITLKMSRRQCVIKLRAEINNIQPINNTKISKIKSFPTEKKMRLIDPCPN